MQQHQKSLLLAAKLGALVASVGRRELFEPTSFPGGAGLIDAANGVGWCLIGQAQLNVDPTDVAALDDPRTDYPRGFLGGSIVWALRNEVRELNIIGDTLNCDDARRASHYESGELSVKVWSVKGRDPVMVSPLDFVSPPVDRSIVAKFETLITDAGAVATYEYGILRAEYLGLEIGRVVRDEAGEDIFRPGVGKHDRLANSMMGTNDPKSELANIIGALSDKRIAGAGVHPGNQLSLSRWMREMALTSPDKFGLDSALARISACEPVGLKALCPAFVSALSSGSTVGFSVGFDLDCITSLMDVGACGPNGSLVLVSDVEYGALTLLVGYIKGWRALELTVVPNWRSQ